MDLLHLEDASSLYIHSAPWGKVGVYNPSPELRGSLTAVGLALSSVKYIIIEGALGHVTGSVYTYLWVSIIL